MLVCRRKYPICKSYFESKLNGLRFDGHGCIEWTSHSSTAERAKSSKCESAVRDLIPSSRWFLEPWLQLPPFNGKLLARPNFELVLVLYCTPISLINPCVQCATG